MLVNEVIVEKQLLAIYVPLNYLLESVYQIDCIKSKALFYHKVLKACFNTLKQQAFIKHFFLICYFCTILLKMLYLH
jgi:hypothetical protein